MIRLFFMLGLVVVVAIGLVALAETSGGVSFDLPGQKIEISWVVAVVALTCFCALLLLANWLLKTVFIGPGAYFRRRRTAREQRGYHAVSRGIVASASGDFVTAQRAYKESGKLLKNEPMVRMLGANVASMAGNDIAFKNLHTEMLTDRKTRVLGLKGLYHDALDNDEQGKARTHAEEALQLNAKTTWAAQALFDLACREKRWLDATDLLDRLKAAELVSLQQFRRRRTVLLTAAAEDLMVSQASKALDRASEAVRLSPDFVPANLLLSRIYVKLGDKSKALKVLRKACSHGLHPQILEAFVDLEHRPAEEQGAQVKRFVGRRKDLSEEVRIFLAGIAAKAGMWVEVESQLQPFLADPTEKTCVIMASLEEYGHDNREAARQWLARAVRARPDKIWVAETHRTRRWRPLSLDLRLDAYEWRQPSSTAASPQVIEALEHELTLAMPVPEPVELPMMDKTEPEGETSDQPEEAPAQEEKDVEIEVIEAESDEAEDHKNGSEEQKMEHDLIFIDPSKDLPTPPDDPGADRQSK